LAHWTTSESSRRSKRRYAAELRARQSNKTKLDDFVLFNNSDCRHAAGKSSKEEKEWKGNGKEG